MIKADARAKFTLQDFEFIATTLAPQPYQRRALEQLIQDEALLIRLLGEETLFRAVLERKSLTRISPHLFFYILLRKILWEARLDDPGVVEYLTSLLAEFRHQGWMYRISGVDEREYYSIVDLLQSLEEATPHQAFHIYSHIGNHALFLAGLFPGYLRSRGMRRARPPLEYYETMGSTGYRAAAHLPLAAQHGLDEILEELSEQFIPLRQALNRMAERYLTWRQEN